MNPILNKMQVIDAVNEKQTFAAFDFSFFISPILQYPK